MKNEKLKMVKNEKSEKDSESFNKLTDTNILTKKGKEISINRGTDAYQDEFTDW